MYVVLCPQTFVGLVSAWRGVVCGLVEGMSERVRVRRLTHEEGQALQRIVRRGAGKSPGSHVRWRRGVVVHASAGGNSVAVIAQLAATSPDRVREMIHRFNESGMASLDPQWAGGRPRRITTDDDAFIVETARTRPKKLAQPFTRWSVRKLAAYLADNPTRVVRVGRQRLHEILTESGITFGRTKTWKESNDPDRDAKLDRIEHVIDKAPDRVFAFDEFGPLAVRPTGGACWAPRSRPQRLRANYNKLGVRQFRLLQRRRRRAVGRRAARKSAANTLAALKTIRARRPDGGWVYVILDNLSAHNRTDIAKWAKRNKVELCCHPHLQLMGRSPRCNVVAAQRRTSQDPKNNTASNKPHPKRANVCGHSVREPPSQPCQIGPVLRYV